MLTDFKNSFTAGLSTKLTAKLLLHLPHKHVVIVIVLSMLGFCYFQSFNLLYFWGGVGHLLYNFKGAVGKTVI